MGKIAAEVNEGRVRNFTRRREWKKTGKEEAG
jgi:hypothetical protein